MKTRLLSISSVVLSLPVMMALSTSGLMVAGCGGGGGGGGGGVTREAGNLISNFEDTVAVVTMDGGRNGYWYTYNDTTCTQMPIPDPQAMAMGVPAQQFVPALPPSESPNGGGMALHSTWSACTGWGAGVGADLGQPAQADGGNYMGPKVAYDVTAFKGVVFDALVPAGSNGKLRVKFPMIKNTKVEDGGTCVESSTNKCSDDWGALVTVDMNGTWKEVVVPFSGSNFKQEGWGAIFAWDPANVTSMQIQNQGGESMSNFDIWVDNIYFY